MTEGSVSSSAREPEPEDDPEIISGTHKRFSALAGLLGDLGTNKKASLVNELLANIELEESFLSASAKEEGPSGNLDIPRKHSNSWQKDLERSNSSMKEQSLTSLNYSADSSPVGAVAMDTKSSEQREAFLQRGKELMKGDTKPPQGAASPSQDLLSPSRSLPIEIVPPNLVGGPLRAEARDKIDGQPESEASADNAGGRRMQATALRFKAAVDILKKKEAEPSRSSPSSGSGRQPPSRATRPAAGPSGERQGEPRPSRSSGSWPALFLHCQGDCGTGVAHDDDDGVAGVRTSVRIRMSL